jgi:hypothetical protein
MTRAEGAPWIERTERTEWMAQIGGADEDTTKRLGARDRGVRRGLERHVGGTRADG